MIISCKLYFNYKPYVNKCQEVRCSEPQLNVQCAILDIICIVLWLVLIHFLSIKCSGFICFLMCKYLIIQNQRQRLHQRQRLQYSFFHSKANELVFARFFEHRFQNDVPSPYNQKIHNQRQRFHQRGDFISSFLHFNMDRSFDKPRMTANAVNWLRMTLWIAH